MNLREQLHRNGPRRRRSAVGAATGTATAARAPATPTPAPRRRTTSNRHTAAAAAAFSDSMPPGIGIVARSVAAAASAGDRPAPSLPRATATRPLHRRVEQRHPALRDRRDQLAAGRGVAPRPCGQVDVLGDVEMEMGAHRRAQHLRRPGERAVLRQQRQRDPRGRGGAQDRADVAGILQVVEQHAEIESGAPGVRRRRRRRRHRHHGDACRRPPAARPARRRASPARSACGRRGAPPARSADGRARKSSATISVSGGPRRAAYTPTRCSPSSTHRLALRRSRAEVSSRSAARRRGFWREVIRCMRRGSRGDRDLRSAPRRRPVLQLEEHLVLPHHAELGARALLDRLEAGLQVADFGVEGVVARLQLGVRLALRRRPAGRARAPAASRPCRATSDTAARRSSRRRRGPAGARRPHPSWKNAARPG